MTDFCDLLIIPHVEVIKDGNVRLLNGMKIYMHWGLMNEAIDAGLYIQVKRAMLPARIDWWKDISASLGCTSATQDNVRSGETHLVHVEGC
jgi:hypothetical protein